MQYQLFRQFIDAISSISLSWENTLEKSLSTEVHSDNDSPSLESRIEARFSQESCCPIATARL